MRESSQAATLEQERKKLFELLDELCELEFQLGVSTVNRYRARSRKLKAMLAEKDRQKEAK
jgi:hypothetical protein